MMYAHCQEKIDFGCSWELTNSTFHKHANSEVQKPTGVGKRSLLQQAQKVMVCDWWTLICFVFLCLKVRYL